jgi:nucleotide-binding universal stress UspA family protein
MSHGVLTLIVLTGFAALAGLFLYLTVLDADRRRKRLDAILAPIGFQPLEKAEFEPVAKRLRIVRPRHVGKRLLMRLYRRPSPAGGYQLYVCNLIVMGARGRSARQGLLLGSVSRAVLADSATPVLLLRRARPLPAGQLKVALAYDDSADSRAALDYVLAQRALFGPEFTLQLVHVVDEVPIQVRTALPNLASTEFSHEKVLALRAEAHEAAVARARRKLQEAGIAAVEHMLVGSNPGDALASFVRAESIDLVVIGCRGKTRLQTALLGSVTARLGARSDVPLLLLRRA